jgi:hypothetical protein
MPEFLESYDVDSDSVLVSNTTAETEVYNTVDRIPGGIVGGTLEDGNCLWINARFKVSFVDTAAVLTIRLKYGTTPLVVDLTFQALAGTPLVDLALIVEGFLSALGSPSIQAFHAKGCVELAAADWGGIPNNRSGGIEDSDSDQDLIITAQWNNANAANAVTKDHVTVVKIATPEEVTPPDPDQPLTMLYSVGKLSRLPHSLFKDVTFYAELTHSLDFMGVGSATFTRASTSTATWRDGAAHAVAANQPRFEYSGEVPRGLLFSTVAGEALNFPTTNNLSDAGILFYVLDGVVKKAPSDTNPINGSGNLSGVGVHYRDLLKFRTGRVLSAQEIAAVTAILATPD